jgi:deoxyribodipyrimidine photolyase-related protein
MQEVSLIFPHQLFSNHPTLRKGRKVVLTEDELFFRQFRFHKQKLVLHRASMKQFSDLLLQENHGLTYIETGDTRDSIKGLISWLSSQGTKVIHCCDPDDYMI